MSDGDTVWTISIVEKEIPAFYLTGPHYYAVLRPSKGEAFVGPTTNSRFQAVELLLQMIRDGGRFHMAEALDKYVGE